LKRQLLDYRTAWHVAGWSLIATVIYLSLTPDPVTTPIDNGDKYEHVAAYAVLMFWFAHLHREGVARLGLACAFLLMAVALEFVQRTTGYRTFEIADMASGAVGVCAGWILAPPRSPNMLGILESRWPLRR
jgi:VanZ family protein